MDDDRDFEMEKNYNLKERMERLGIDYLVRNRLKRNRLRNLELAMKNGIDYREMRSNHGFGNLPWSKS